MWSYFHSQIHLQENHLYIYRQIRLHRGFVGFAEEWRFDDEVLFQKEDTEHFRHRHLDFADRAPLADTQTRLLHIPRYNHNQLNSINLLKSNKKIT